jgi:hypothetical protein
MLEYNEIQLSMKNATFEKSVSTPKSSFIKRQKTEVDTVFILRGINPAELDKQYSMNEFINVANREFGFSIDHFSNGNDFFPLKKTKKTNEVKTKLESLGIIKDQIPRIDTIVISEHLNFKICVSPTNNGENRDIISLRSVCCWHCKHHFSKHPLSIPLKFLAKQDKFESEGVFCSFNCILAYIREYPLNKYRESGGLLCMLYHKIFDKRIRLTDITPAPNWRLLMTFGGPLSIEEFRKSFQTIEFRENLSGQYTNGIEHSEIPLITRSEVFITEGDFN